MNDSPGLLARALRIFSERPFLYVATAALPYFTVHLALWWLLLSLPAMQIAPGDSIRDKLHSLSDAQLAVFLLTLVLWAMAPTPLRGAGFASPLRAKSAVSTCPSAKLQRIWRSFF